MPTKAEPTIPLQLAGADASALEAAAAQLLDMIRPVDKPSPSKAGWQPDRPVVAAFSKENVVGPVWTWRHDSFTDVVIERTLHSESGVYRFNQETCAHLDALAEQWAMNASLTNLTTTERMRGRLLNWCAQVLETGKRSSSVDFALSDLKSHLATHEVWVQISGVDVEDAVPLGKVELRGVSAACIESWILAMLESGMDSRAAEGMKPYLEKRWQGQTAAVFKAYGDIGAVREAAIEHAERSCALLRAVDPQNVSARTRSHLQPLTVLSQANLREIAVNPGALNSSFSSPLGDEIPAAPVGLTISRENLVALWHEGSLGDAHNLLSAEQQTAFQKDLTRALLIYSRQRLSVDPIEKLIFTISALESILFPKHTKKRLSAVLAGSAQMREFVETNVTAAYNLRNKFLHHGQRLEDLKSVQNFLWVAWEFFRRALAHHESWSTIGAYHSDLDGTFEQRFEKSSTS